MLSKQHSPQGWQHTHVTPALRKLRIMVLRLAWTTVTRPQKKYSELTYAFINWHNQKWVLKIEKYFPSLRNLSITSSSKQYYLPI